MDATTTAAKALAAGDGAAPSSPLNPAPEPLPGDVSAAADPASATARTSTIVESGGEDEQFEKFYALLANIRAMRGMYRSDSGVSTDSAAGEVCGGGRKRARWAEPSWRPAFRIEDFEEAPAGSASSKKEERRDGGSRRPGKETTEEEAGGEGGDDVERKRRPVAVTPSSQRNV